MFKPIKSTDPRKPFIVNAIKLKTKCQRVTLVYQVGEGIYEGQALRTERRDNGKARYSNLGMIRVTDRECGFR